MDTCMELSKRSSGELMKRDVSIAAEEPVDGPGVLTVGLLERALLGDFPSSDAESWDRTGLQVGDPAARVAKVAVALDATVPAIRQAAEAGANVLVTHHPPYLEAPDAFRPADSVALVSGAGVWVAVRSNVALLCFHTALDVSPLAADTLPGLLGLERRGMVLEPAASCRASLHPAKGYGQVCSVREQDEPMTLEKLAARCTAVLGRQPRVWGDASRTLSEIATTTGSAGGIAKAAIKAGIDCLVCGEVKYHDALDAAQAGLAILDLGHDVSEIPLTRVLADAIVRAGVPFEDIVIIDQSSNWTNLEAERMQQPVENCCAQLQSPAL